MAIDTTVFATDLAGMVADLPTAAKFNATSFNCSATELSQEETLILVGNTPKKAISIVFPISALSDATFKPQARLQLKFPTPSAFVNYEIVSIETSQDLVAYEVLLKADNRA